MKIKVSETTNTQLDWLVAHSAELVVIQVKNGHTYVPKYPIIGGQRFTPTTDWSQGGPIIEREGMWLRHFTADDPDMARWEAINGWFPANVVCTGPTPLIAAMRCYVASKLGDEVEVLDELGEQS